MIDYIITVVCIYAAKIYVCQAGREIKIENEIDIVLGIPKCFNTATETATRHIIAVSIVLPA